MINRMLLMFGILISSMVHGMNACYPCKKAGGSRALSATTLIDDMSNSRIPESKIERVYRKRLPLIVNDMSVEATLPLVVSLRYVQGKCLSLLLKAGAYIDVPQDSDGKSAIDVVCEQLKAPVTYDESDMISIRDPLNNRWRLTCEGRIKSIEDKLNEKFPDALPKDSKAFHALLAAEYRQWWRERCPLRYGELSQVDLDMILAHTKDLAREFIKKARRK